LAAAIFQACMVSARYSCEVCTHSTALRLSSAATTGTGAAIWRAAGPVETQADSASTVAVIRERAGIRDMGTTGSS
jgi:hypothetical protein